MGFPTVPDQPPVTAPGLVDSFQPVQVIEGKPAAASLAPKAQGSCGTCCRGVRQCRSLCPLLCNRFCRQGRVFCRSRCQSRGVGFWKGAPWRQVLGDMLASLGLSFREQAGLVQIIKPAVGGLPPVRADACG